MGVLIVMGYDDMLKADSVLVVMARRQKEGLLTLEDAAIVRRGEDSKVDVRKSGNLAAMGGLRGCLGRMGRDCSSISSPASSRAVPWASPPLPSATPAWMMPP